VLSVQKQIKLSVKAWRSDELYSQVFNMKAENQLSIDFVKDEWAKV